MKKLILLIMLMSLCLVLISCNKNNSNQEINDGKQNNEATQEDDDAYSEDNDDTQEDNEDTQPTPEVGEKDSLGGLIYENKDYGFNFNLPKSWEGYTVVTSHWEGLSLDGKVTQSGPLLSIRHPQWTEQNQRQDIPVMIFTLDQWMMIQKEEIHIGAAPIAPSELGKNGKYVFALPARYNYAFPTGFEEVEKIIESRPLIPTEK